MGIFKDIPLHQPDPILGLNRAFAEDQRPNKINLGVGAYKTEELTPFILPSVKKAEEEIFKKNLNKEYLPIEGDPLFLKSILPLVVGEAIPHEQLCVVQAIGGTGALRVGAQFLVEHLPAKVFVSSPTWANHPMVFGRSGLAVDYYPYYDSERKGVHFEALLKKVEQMDPNTILVLHACCHNPTGCDLAWEQWEQLAQMVQKKQILPFLDFAYQGFGEGLEEDAKPLRHFLKLGIQCLVAVSFSKNFGLYGERMGALMIACKDKEEATRVMSQVRMTIRGIYSSPPSTGARIISTILSNADLKKQWEGEVATMRGRLREMRVELVKALQENGVHDFDFLLKQKGMFNFTGLSAAATEQLKTEYAIYMTRDGRISLAGLNHKNLPLFVEAILKVRGMK